VVERWHSVERVRQGPEAQSDRQHSFAIARAGVTRRADDPFSRKTRNASLAPSISGPSLPKSRHFARIEHFLRASGTGSQQPLIAMNAPKLRLRNGPSNARRDSERRWANPLQLVGRFDDLRCGMEHDSHGAVMTLATKPSCRSARTRCRRLRRHYLDLD